MSGTAGTDVPGTQSPDTPGTGNVSDGTPAGTPGTAPNRQNDDAASRSASTQSHDTPSIDALFTKFADRLDAMPEQIINAIKEAAPAPSSTATPDNSTSNAGTGQSGVTDAGNSAVTSDTVTRSRGERFAGWWFGK